MGLVVASCCRGACFPLSQPLSPPLPSLQQSLHSLPPPSTCSRSSGWVWAGLLQTRALCHPAPPLPLTLPPPPAAPPLSSLAISLFPFCPAHLAWCCVIYSSLGDMWSLCWIPRTAGSQCFWRRRKKEQGKQSDTTGLLSGHSVRPENMYTLPEDTDYT